MRGPVPPSPAHPLDLGALTQASPSTHSPRGLGWHWGSPEAVRPQGMCWHKRAVTCRGSSLPSHAARALGTKTKARRAANSTALILAEVCTPAHLRGGERALQPPEASLKGSECTAVGGR